MFIPGQPNPDAGLVANPQTWTSTQTFTNATYSALFLGGPVGINNATPTQPLHVGPVAAASGDVNILSARNSTGAASTHGFAENSTINLSAAGLGMDSFDARMVVSGTQTYDHLVSYQSRAIYGSSGLMTNAYGGYDGFTANGPVTNQYGWYVATPGFEHHHQFLRLLCRGNDQGRNAELRVLHCGNDAQQVRRKYYCGVPDGHWFRCHGFGVRHGRGWRGYPDHQ